MTGLAAPRRLVARAARATVTAVGSRARLKVVATLAAVLALSAADAAAVGAAGPQLQRAFHIGKPQIGLLIAVTSAIGAVATVPAGVLVDRVDRARLLRWAVASWGVATAISGCATSFAFLLVTRIGLGLVVAVAGPAVASLIGDYFAESERSRIYGYVLGGELVGTGFGFIVSGDLAVISWRAAFLSLVPPAAALTWALLHLREPARGGGDRLPSKARPQQGQTPARGDAGRSTFAAVEPREANVLRRGADELSLIDAVRYVLRIPTNIVLIVSSALGYFFLAGVRGFGVEFVRHHYGVSQAQATSLVPVIGVGMLVGVLVAGRVADRRLSKGHRAARVSIAAITVLAAAALFVPALLTTSLAIAVPLLVLCGVGMGGTNPPLDAARLDVMPPGLWGRAEAVRTVLQAAAQAAAPILFGVLASDVFGGRNGLRDAFLLSLIPLAVAAVLLLVIGRRTYPADASTALASRDPYPERLPRTRAEAPA